MRFASEPLFALVGTTVDDLINAERTVQLGDQIEPDVPPLVSKPGQQRAVQRDAAALLLRDRHTRLANIIVATCVGGSCRSKSYRWAAILTAVPMF
jgi:hypothetical protein